MSQDLLHCFLLSQECTPNIDGADSISTGKRTHDDYVNIIKFFLWCHSIRNRWLETWQKLPSIYLLGVLFICFSIELHVYKYDVVHFLFLSNNNSREKGKKLFKFFLPSFSDAVLRSQSELLPLLLRLDTRIIGSGSENEADFGSKTLLSRAPVIVNLVRKSAVFLQVSSRQCTHSTHSSAEGN